MSSLLDSLGSLVAQWPDWAASVITVVAAIVAALVLHRIAMAVLARLSARSPWIAEGVFERLCNRPLEWVILFGVLRSVAAAAAPQRTPDALFAALTVGLILSLGWLASRLVGVAERSVTGQLQLDVRDNLRARRLYTQIRFLRRFVTVIIVVLTGGALLMSFDSLRQLGAGLLTSAGIAGVVIGFAAQRTVGNLIAGFQIAFTQPIRTDDVVIVEGEWGRIEEITLTYVVVRIWDDRRLIVPISHFIERPFQNWTRVSADLLGTVYLHVDYGVPLDDLRAELRRLAEASEHWDGRVCVVHVVEARERTLEVRALVSAASSGDAWELRCAVREGLVRWLQQHHPESLPRLRAEVAPAPDAAAAKGEPARSG